MLKANGRSSKPERPWCLAFFVTALLIGAFLLVSVMKDSNKDIFCPTSYLRTGSSLVTTTNDNVQLRAILHYATSKTTPQQSLDEVSITYNVLRSIGKPVNFLVFGLGHDSLMWDAFNPGGKTIFLEEDPEWVKTVLKKAPNLRAHTIKYRTKLSEADELIDMFNNEPACFAKNAVIRGNEQCKLALNMLPDEVLDTEWDLIMIDAPKGYFPEAPGRMAAIFTAAVMARNRKGSGVTHVFLHDVDRKVEKTYGEMILCKKNRVKGVGRLWHFEITPSTDMNKGFC